MSNYYLIHNDDGDTTVEQLTKAEVEAWVNEEDRLVRPQFWDTKPDRLNTNYWNDKYLIIKGEIAVPRPVEIVRRYELP